GESLAGARHTQRLMLDVEIIAGPFLLLAVFGGLLVVGLRALAPVEHSRRRIQGESHRLRQLVEDMLWLARFDSKPPLPGSEPVDLATLAQACADRFRAVGPAVRAETPDGAVLISAPPEWIDRLAGVLVDNACRYAGPDGTVRIEVRAQGSRVSLTV